MMILYEEGNIKELEKDGRPVTSMTHFTTESDYQKSIFEMTGTVDVLFEPIDVSDLGGSSIVIYEYLYIGNGTDEDNEYTDYENEDIFPVKHENPKDEDQTVHVIKIGTSASEGETTDDGKASIISFTSLCILRTYSGCPDRSLFFSYRGNSRAYTFFVYRRRPFTCGFWSYGDSGGS